MSPAVSPKQAASAAGVDALAVVRALWSIHHALEAASETMESRIGITATQRIVIRTLGQFPGTTPTALAEALGVHPGTASAQIRRLEERGLITRTRDPRDARRVLLGLTAAGRAFDRPMDGTLEQVIHDALGRVPADDLERTLGTLATFRAALQSLRNASQHAPAHTEKHHGR